MAIMNLLKYTRTKWGTEPPSVIVERIAQGEKLPTQALALSNNATYRAQIVSAGGVEKILEFLKQSDQPFKNILPQNSKSIPCPSIWFDVLSNFCQDGYVQPQSLARQTQYQILEALGSLLFPIMSNVKEGTLFGSRKVWIKSLMFFSSMLADLLTSEYRRLSEFLLHSKLLKTFLVRVVALPVCDPRVAKEIMDVDDPRLPKPDILGLSQTFAASCIKYLTTKQEDRTILEDFMATPFKPEHELTLQTGIISVLLKSNTSGWYQGGLAAIGNVFIQIYDRVGRLSSQLGLSNDECAAVQLVQVGGNYLMEAYGRDKFFLENVVTLLVALGASLMTPVVDGKQAPMDYNVGQAIRHGMMDFFLDIADTGDARLSKPLEGLIRLVASTVPLEDSSAALQAESANVRARMRRVQARHPYLMTSVSMIETLLKNPLIKPPSERDICSFCTEKAQAGQMRRCPFCMDVCYCSQDCQVLNWMLHQTICVKTRKGPSMISIEGLERQGKAIFSQYVSKILLQAGLKGVMILDCIVVIDLCEKTPHLKTISIERFVDYYVQDEEFLDASLESLAKNKVDGSLTVAFAAFLPERGLYTSLYAFSPNSAPKIGPVVSAPDQSKWTVAQRMVFKASFQNGGLQFLQKNPKAFQAAILKTMKP